MWIERNDYAHLTLQTSGTITLTLKTIERLRAIVHDQELGLTTPAEAWALILEELESLDRELAQIP
jgi:hypothetical protein